MMQINKIPLHVALTFPRTYNRILSSTYRYSDPLSRGFLIFTLISEILRITTYIYEHGTREITIDLLPRPIIEKLKIDIDFIEHILIKILQKIESINPTIILFDDTNIRKVIFTATEDKYFKLNIIVGYDYEKEIKRALEASITKISQLNNKNIIEILSTFRQNLIIENDPDLTIIFGEETFPNFIPLELAYSELIFIDKEIVEIKKEDIEKALKEYSKRHRRFGK